MKFGSIPVTLSSATPVVYTYGGILNYTDNVSISYNGAAPGTLVAGDYVDTITFTISAL